MGFRSKLQLVIRSKYLLLPAVYGGTLLWLLWTWGAIVFSPLLPEVAITIIPLLLLALAVAALVPSRIRRTAIAALFIVLTLHLVWWRSIEPASQGEWEPEVARLPSAEIAGDVVSLRNIRNFNYASGGVVIPSYYDKSFDLRELTSVDLISVYWAGAHIAHVIVSFGFNEKDFIAFSIEIRKRKGQEYSTLAGIFKNYELMYVAADERDLLRLRTTYRNPTEDVYLFRVPMRKDRAQKLFREYLRKINELHSKPEFYNTLTTNCTTNVLLHAQAIGTGTSYTWKTLLSGHFAEYIYSLAPERVSMPFKEIRERGYINRRSQEFDQAEDYSVKIREGVPFKGLLPAPVP